MKDIFKKIRELSEKYRDDTARNLSKLVKIKSLSTQEKEVQQELKRQMEEAGFDEVKIDGLGNRKRKTYSCLRRAHGYGGFRQFGCLGF